jgi:hypothetical protein
MGRQPLLGVILGRLKTLIEKESAKTRCCYSSPYQFSQKSSGPLLLVSSLALRKVLFTIFSTCSWSFVYFRLFSPNSIFRRFSANIVVPHISPFLTSVDTTTSCISLRFVSLLHRGSALFRIFVTLFHLWASSLPIRSFTLSPHFSQPHPSPQVYELFKFPRLLLVEFLQFICKLELVCLFAHKIPMHLQSNLLNLDMLSAKPFGQHRKDLALGFCF